MNKVLNPPPSLSNEYQPSGATLKDCCSHITYQLNNHVRIYHFHPKNVRDIHIILQIKGKISVDKTYNPKGNYLGISNVQ